MSKEIFKVNVSKYCSGQTQLVTGVSTLDHPIDHTVMFVTKRFMPKAERLLDVKGCLVFYDKACTLNAEVQKRHICMPCERPRLEFCRFFQENNIAIGPPAPEQFENIGGAWISPRAKIGKNATIMPGARICGDAEIGDDAYIGYDVKILCALKAGRGVVLRENVILAPVGAGGANERDYDGRLLPFPQIGGIFLGDGVELGTHTLVSAGAIDDTVIGAGTKIDMYAHISHNVEIGENCDITGGVRITGSVKVGNNVYFAPNALVVNRIKIGDNAYIGLGAVVIHSVRDGVKVFGNPARPVEV